MSSSFLSIPSTVHVDYQANERRAEISARREDAQATGSAEDERVAVTYGWPQTQQQAPSLSGAPQTGQANSRTSPHAAQRRAEDTGAEIKRDGRNKRRPSTTYGTFDGQRKLGQKPLTFPSAGVAAGGGKPSFPAGCSMGISNISERRITASSDNFVPSPASNADKAGCLQPISAARDTCEMPLSLRILPT